MGLLQRNPQHDWLTKHHYTDMHNVTDLLKGTSGKQSKLKWQYEGKSRPLDAVKTGKSEHLPTVRQATEVEGAGYFYRRTMNMFAISMPWLTPDSGNF